MFGRGHQLAEKMNYQYHQVVKKYVIQNRKK